ncbi:hypothetical protein OE903_16795 [Bacillus sp. B6(2022)]|nr:hypothetical protein [Bacillus sp. B6(2022)]
MDHLVYLSVGSEEGKGKTSAQQHMPLFNKQLHDLLLQKGMQERKLHFHIEQGEGHHLKQFQKISYRPSSGFIKENPNFLSASHKVDMVYWNV